MDESEAEYQARMMSELERKVILVCSKGTSIGYFRMAKETGESYSDTQKAGLSLQKLKLAHVSPTRHSDEYSGSAIFLNDRGEMVRAAVAKLMSGQL